MPFSAPRTWVAGELVTAALLNTELRDAMNLIRGSISDAGHLSLTAASELTISSGAVTVAQSYHTIDTESDASSDDLDTLTAGSDVSEGYITIIRAVNAARTVVVRHNTGNIQLAGGRDVQLDDVTAAVALIYDGADWIELTPGSGTDLTFDSAQQATTAVTSEEVLYTYTIPAGAMSQDGQGLIIEAHGTFAANTNNKTLRIRIGGVSGTVIAGGTTITGQSDRTIWSVRGEIRRNGVDVQQCAGYVMWYDTGDATGNITGQISNAAGAEDDASTIDVVVTGQNGTANANDIVYEWSTVRAN